MNLKKLKWKRLLLICFSSFVILYIVSGLIFYHVALNANNTHSRSVGEKQYVPSPSISTELEQQQHLLDQAFLQQVLPTEIQIQSHDSLTLQGYEFLQAIPSNKWIFAVHGYTGSTRQMTRWNRQLYELGYNIFAVDLRGHGESDGDYYGMGWLDQPDLRQWIELLINRYPSAEISLYGVSMGASAVLNLSGDALPSQVKSIVADSAYTSVDDIFSTQLQSVLHLPRFPIMHAANTIAKLRIQLDFKEASTQKRVQSATLPILIIHGEADTFVPVKNAYTLSKAISSAHQLWIVPDANHADAVKIDPLSYRNYIDKFINSYH